MAGQTEPGADRGQESGDSASTSKVSGSNGRASPSAAEMLGSELFDGAKVRTYRPRPMDNKNGPDRYLPLTETELEAYVEGTDILSKLIGVPQRCRKYFTPLGRPQTGKKKNMYKVVLRCKLCECGPHQREQGQNHEMYTHLLKHHLDVLSKNGDLEQFKNDYQVCVKKKEELHLKKLGRAASATSNNARNNQAVSRSSSSETADTRALNLKRPFSNITSADEQNQARKLTNQPVAVAGVPGVFQMNGYGVSLALSNPAATGSAAGNVLMDPSSSLAAMQMAAAQNSNQLRRAAVQQAPRQPTPAQSNLNGTRNGPSENSSKVAVYTQFPLAEKLGEESNLQSLLAQGAAAQLQEGNTGFAKSAAMGGRFPSANGITNTQDFAAMQQQHLQLLQQQHLQLLQQQQQIQLLQQQQQQQIQVQQQQLEQLQLQFAQQQHMAVVAAAMAQTPGMAGSWSPSFPVVQDTNNNRDGTVTTATVEASETPAERDAQKKS